MNQNEIQVKIPKVKQSQKSYYVFQWYKSWERKNTYTQMCMHIYEQLRVEKKGKQ